MIVVDASLATKWLFLEEDSDRALSFLARNGHELHGPDLLLTEVAGAIIRRANFDKDAERARHAVAEWRRMWDDGHLTAHRPTTDRVQAAAALGLRLGHPLADCMYLQLAIELGCELATCDGKFAARARRDDDRVRLLREYDL